MAITTIIFEDHGQDFIEWDINENGEVINSRPFQSHVWSGGTVLNEELKAGDSVIYLSPRLCRPIEIRYPIASVKSTCNAMDTVH